MEKLEAATRYHEIVGMLNTNLNQDEVNAMIKKNKTFFQDFQDLILIPSQNREIMVQKRSRIDIALANQNLERKGQE